MKHFYLEIVSFFLSFFVPVKEIVSYTAFVLFMTFGNGFCSPFSLLLGTESPFVHLQFLE